MVPLLLMASTLPESSGIPEPSDDLPLELPARFLQEPSIPQEMPPRAEQARTNLAYTS
jgi:hypothetical protein